jgi:solute carrier family 25 folate transporter 32
MAASMMSVLCTQPMDVVKTQYQVARLNSSNPRTTKIIKNIATTSGIKGFYRGIGPSLISYPIFWGAYFPIKNYNFEPSGYNLVDKFIVACGASSIASTITNPLFVIKTRVQTLDTNYSQSNNQDKSNYKKLCKSIYNEEGIKGFYKGLKPTIINNTKLGIQFPLYEYFKKETNSIILASGLAKAFASTIFYPMDLIRVNQRDTIKNISIMKTTKQIYKKSGIIGFYRGVLIYNIVNGSNFILMMVFKEYIDDKISL